MPGLELFAAALGVIAAWLRVNASCRALWRVAPVFPA